MVENKISQDRSLCTGCSACYSICPVKAISMKENEEGFLYPSVDYSKCIKCGKCISICPTINHKLSNNDESVDVYVAYNTDEKIRERSSSGGVFTLIAENILNDEGIVYGAAFDDQWNVVHRRVDNINDLDLLRGSKYVQSNLCDTYSRCVYDLKNGKKVLFSGTPCQIAGLYSFLGKPYNNLFTVDIICHGVPSPLVWRKYISEKFDLKNIKYINFRSKTNGWRDFSMRIEESCAYDVDKREDVFMNGFLDNLYLRASCHNCRFKSVGRISDITLADAWGVDEFKPELYCSTGTSMVLIQSERGKQLLNDISKYLEISKVPVSVVTKYNSAVNKSVPKHKNREIFFSKLNDCESVCKIIDKLIDQRSLRKKISFAIRSRLKSLFK